MAGSISDLVATGQNAVQAINNLAQTFASFFPQVTSTSTAVRGSDGTIVYNSSLATAFLAVTTSSGFVGYVPIYPSS